ncbi:pentapeptide repeat-containing protein [Streptomyces xylophagus]|uniref:pentapeptide repeat-containing protein n=1 Tax=Streptomyces xylophagus TaxID=285514 RepID=UPI001F3CE5E7|nr:pentapeptide repeat-containing protein [Streptomyces xylophagus]
MSSPTRSGESSGDRPSDFEPLRQANEKIREAAKWLIGSSAAVGAALLAGSQLSNIGKLDWGARFVVALVGAGIGLAAVVAAIWLAVGLMIPVVVTIDQLDDAWTGKRSRDMATAVGFLINTPSQMGEWDSPGDLKRAYASSEKRLARAAERGEAEVVQIEQHNLDSIERWMESIEQVSQNRVLEGRFKRTLWKLLVAAIFAAVGIVAFAWASNPPEDTPSATLKNARLSGDFLRDADLKNAKLDHADLTGADLTGANLEGASLTGVTWKNTVCPDGKNSDDVGGSCAGHLTPVG